MPAQTRQRQASAARTRESGASRRRAGASGSRRQAGAARRQPRRPGDRPQTQRRAPKRAGDVSRAAQAAKRREAAEAKRYAQAPAGEEKKGVKALFRRKPKRKWAMSRDERKAQRRGIAFRVLACVVMVGLSLALALVVGTDEYRPTAVGWIPFIAVVTAIVIAFVYLRVLKHSLKLLERSNVTDCRREEKVRFKVRFSNRCPLFFTRIEAHFYTADLYGNPVNHAVTTLTLAPFEKYDMPFTTKFEHIGTYQAGLDRVVVYDFLRLFSATIEGPKHTRVNVTPKLVDIPRIEFSNDAVVETTKAARSALSDSMDYAAVRDYVWGDPMKNIHWKLSSRGEGLMTKLFETYTNPGVSVVLDFYGPGANALELMHLFDAVVETGFSVARYAQSRGMDTEIHYVDRTGARVHRTTWRSDELPQIVSEMPRFSSNPEAAADAMEIVRDQARSIHSQNNIVICTANLSAQMMEEVMFVKAQHRAPLLFAIVPRGLEGRDRDQWLAPLARLDAAGIAYTVIVSSDDLKGVRV